MGRRAAGIAVLCLALLGVTACEPLDGRDLSLTVATPPASVEAGGSVTFDATLANVGTAAATGTAVTVVFPLGLDAAVAAPELLGCAAPVHLTGTEALAVICQVSTVAPSATVTLEVTLSSDVAGLEGEVGMLATSTGGNEPIDGSGAPQSLRFPFSVTPASTVDLQVLAPAFDQTLRYGTSIDSRTQVLNRGAQPAGPVTVTQEFPAGFDLGSAELHRTGGGATGTCSILGQVATCTTGAAVVAPFSHPGDAWEMVASVVPTSGSYFEIAHSASSPAPEPSPDPSPNTATASGWRDDGSYGAYLALDAPATVAAGATFDVPVAWVGSGFGQYVSVYIPPNLRLESFFGCSGTGSLSCASPLPFIGGFPGGNTTVLHLTALAPGGPGQISLSISSEGGGASGQALVQTVDPSITSDVHPTLNPPPFGLTGEPVTIPGEVRAAGPTPHDDVQAVFDVPPGSVIRRATWGDLDVPCPIDGRTATCELGAMDGYDHEPLELVLTSYVPGPAPITVAVTSATAQDEPDPWPDSVTIDLPIRAPFTDLGITATQSPDPPTQGVTHATTYTLTNHGSDPATGTILSVQVPGGYTAFRASFLAPTPPDTSCTIVDQTVTCAIGPMEGGSSLPLQILATAGPPGAAVYSASVHSDQAEPSPDVHPNSTTVAVYSLAPNADLLVQYPSSPIAPVVVGTPIVLPIRVTNRGPSKVTQVYADVSIPDGWHLDTIGGAGDGCTITGQTATCGPWEPISFTSGWTLYLQATPTVPGLGGLFTTTVRSELPDPGSSSNTVVQAIDALPNVVDLGFVMSGWSLYGQGGTGTFAVLVTNRGPAPAPGVVLTGRVPDAATIVGATGNGYTCTWSAHDVACTFDQPMIPGSGTWGVTLSMTYADVPGPLFYDFSLTSALPEATPEVLPNTVHIGVVSSQAARGFSGTVVGPDGLPLAGARVRAYAEADGIFPSGIADTAVDGTWQLGNLPPGTYRIVVSGPTGSGLPTEWYPNQPTRTLATPLTIDATTPHRQVDVQLG